ncbi:hypothetical protein JY97_07130 [Alkalispirochaeta odontotermitis]|nr:hypothetical protein JY97_07130 [Alkalispirochaeta odontotermitis]
MRICLFKIRSVVYKATSCLLIAMLAGCAVVGPSSISMGRASYNEAINKTEDEQLLMSIVRSRYGELYSLLAVTGVAANVRFSSSAGVNVGFGDSDDYVGNLVPFSGGVIYEENPTITYAPVQSEQFFRQMLTPIELDSLLLFVRATAEPDKFLTLLVTRINDLFNPDFLPPALGEPDPKFIQFAELTTELRQAGILDWVKDPRQDIAFDMIIRRYAPRYVSQVREYLNLLDLPMSADLSEDIILPVYFAVKGADWRGIAMSTRSTEDLFEILRASIELPEEHARAGIAIDYPPVGLAGKGVRILTSKEKPEKAALATKYRGYWFYIDDSNLRTKEFFSSLKTLWSAKIRSSADEKVAPVLTIPVGG